MDYTMEELIPVVGKLAEKYTAGDSTSITYETAEQLMGAVLYCIHELEESGHNSLILNGETMTAQKAYEIGVLYVEEKVKKALDLYDEVLNGFYHYENQCLWDAVVKELPEFFKRYNTRFEPQNTILTIDYPVLKDISTYTGIDKIYEFITSIYCEQKFLNLFPDNYVITILSKYNGQWKESIENVCEEVFISVIGHLLVGKPLTKIDFDEADYSCIEEIFTQTDLNDICKRLENMVETFVKNYCENDRNLLEYLSGAIKGIVVRFINAADNGVLENML